MRSFLDFLSGIWCKTLQIKGFLELTIEYLAVCFTSCSKTASDASKHLLHRSKGFVCFWPRRRFSPLSCRTWQDSCLLIWNPMSLWLKLEMFSNHDHVPDKKWILGDKSINVALHVKVKQTRTFIWSYIFLPFALSQQKTVTNNLRQSTHKCTQFF